MIKNYVNRIYLIWWIHNKNEMLSIFIFIFLKNSGLINQDDLIKLNWLVHENIFKIIIYKLIYEIYNSKKMLHDVIIQKNHKICHLEILLEVH
jgi:hypothetical protein